MKTTQSISFVTNMTTQDCFLIILNLFHIKYYIGNKSSG